jgi:hypothetical protein
MLQEEEKKQKTDQSLEEIKEGDAPNKRVAK